MPCVGWLNCPRAGGQTGATADAEEVNDEGPCTRAIDVSVASSSRTRQAFWRAFVDGYARRDIAADLGISVNAVYLAKSEFCGASARNSPP
jgi:DNA-directed RNA polymerase specialized sigma24 family protein